MQLLPPSPEENTGFVSWAKKIVKEPFIVLDLFVYFKKKQVLPSLIHMSGVFVVVSGNTKWKQREKLM